MAAGSLGIVVVDSAGTPARATANQTDPAARFGVESIRFQVVPDNAGVIYIYAGLNDGVIPTPMGPCLMGVLPKPSSATMGPFSYLDFELPTLPAGLNAADFWIDAASSDDGVIVSYVTN